MLSLQVMLQYVVCSRLIFLDDDISMFLAASFVVRFIVLIIGAGAALVGRLRLFSVILDLCLMIGLLRQLYWWLRLCRIRWFTHMFAHITTRKRILGRRLIKIRHFILDTHKTVSFLSFLAAIAHGAETKHNSTQNRRLHHGPKYVGLHITILLLHVGVAVEILRKVTIAVRLAFIVIVIVVVVTVSNSLIVIFIVIGVKRIDSVCIKRIISVVVVRSIAI
mmetsp:Transcript_35313/g.57785  ORF Transcript_35313/g.57785 Transcript_35313/m.57785 type:complete len:221 (+) Transcript_35313:97-759(+)